MGKFYFKEHTNCPPTFLQIVGWTKSAKDNKTKRIYVYVRKVPLIVNHRSNGGNWEFDHDIIKKYCEEITEPILSHKKDWDTLTAIFNPTTNEVKYRGNSIQSRNFD